MLYSRHHSDRSPACRRAASWLGLTALTALGLGLPHPALAWEYSFGNGENINAGASTVSAFGALGPVAGLNAAPGTDTLGSLPSLSQTSVPAFDANLTGTLTADLPAFSPAPIPFETSQALTLPSVSTASVGTANFDVADIGQSIQGLTSTASATPMIGTASLAVDNLRVARIAAPVSSVPEPSSLAPFAAARLGLTGLALRARRRGKIAA